MEAAEFLAVLDQFGGPFAPELRDGEQVVGVAAVEVDLDDVVQRFALLIPEWRERVGTHVRLAAGRLPAVGLGGVGQPLLLLRESQELLLVRTDVAGRLPVVVAPEIVDVACCHDGEQEEGGRPFASGEMEFRFHVGKDTTSRWGLSRFLKYFC